MDIVFDDGVAESEAFVEALTDDERKELGRQLADLLAAKSDRQLLHAWGDLGAGGWRDAFGGLRTYLNEVMARTRDTGHGPV